MRLIDADVADKYLYNHLDDLHMIAAQNAIDEMPTIEVQPGWIKCGDKLPDTGVDVLVCEDDGHICVGCLTYYGMFSIDDLCYDIDIDHVIGWMPLPEPPEVTT